MPYYALGYASAGSATKQYFDEAAAYLCAIQSSGMGIEDVHPNKAVLTNGALPIDSEFTCAFGHGMAGITRKEANAIILRLLDKYVDKIRDAPKGKTIEQTYDLTTMKPKEELVALYNEAVKELKDVGVSLK